MSTQWFEAIAVEDVPEEDVVGVMVHDKDIALYKMAGQIYATRNTCTHGKARLSDGFLESTEIECPLHQGRFDICTGKALCAPLTRDLRIFPVKVEDGRIWVELEIE